MIPRNDVVPLGVLHQVAVPVLVSLRCSERECCTFARSVSSIEILDLDLAHSANQKYFIDAHIKKVLIVVLFPVPKRG